VGQARPTASNFTLEQRAVGAADRGLHQFHGYRIEIEYESEK
jgi:hypothetical protein